MKESSKAILFSNNVRDNLCGLCEMTSLVHKIFRVSHPCN